MSQQSFIFGKWKLGVGAAASVAIMSGCASQQPAPQFTQAQHTYETASEGKAAEYAPDELLEAKKLLTRAQEAKNGSKEQIHYSYLADRQARLATSSGSIEYYNDQADQARNEYISRLEQKNNSSQEQLDATRDELASIEQKMQEKDANVEELQARKAELEQRRQELESKLTQSEQARKDAEERASAAMASLNELAQVKEEQNETVITLSGSVLFKTGEATLLPIARTNLGKVADAIKTMDDSKQIVIEGYTDSRGAAEMNDELSQKRAQSVLDYLAQEGVDSSRMKAVGKGESNPVADNSSPEGRANNRRVELHIKNGKSDENKSAKADSESSSPS